MSGSKSKEAYQLLIRDVIEAEEDFSDPKNRWVLHCIYVGQAAGRIASQLGVDSDYAMALGFVHDIGRKWSHPNHVLEGYHYLASIGRNDLAGICLTHSYVNNNLRFVAGEDSTPEEKPFRAQYLLSHPATVYDNIIQICDLFCLETGFTTVEKRMLDITKRKGVFPNSLDHLHAVESLKTTLEAQMGCSLYSLFPEITKEDKAQIHEDHSQLVSLITSNQQKRK